jgi:pantothenate kinase
MTRSTSTWPVSDAHLTVSACVTRADSVDHRTPPVVGRWGVDVSDAPSTLDELVDRAAGLVHEGGRTVIGVVGAPGSGKSTLVDALIAELLKRPAPTGGGGDGPWAVGLPMDGFHLANAVLRELGLADRKGAPETFDGWGFAALMARLTDADEADHTVYSPNFERELEEPVAGAIAVPPSARLVVTEGNYLLLDDPPWAAARAQLAEVWMCDTDEERRMRQLVARHERFGMEPDAARAWAQGPDQANAERVQEAAHRADVRIGEALLLACGE